MKTPFMNGSGVIKFPTDSEESNDGTGNDLHSQRDSADPVGAGLTTLTCCRPSPS